jgi:predicted Rossmann fold flavoprotein
MIYDLIIVGGGAAGFFCAVQSAERNPGIKILILEKSKEVLSKVRISGGGRCNVTHACFDPSELVNFYPRGKKELLGPFHKFLCGDMMGWLADHGVETKIEDDGRVFPASNQSQTIIDCFMNLCEKYHVEINTSTGVEKVYHQSSQWQITSKDNVFISNKLLIATGSSPATWKILDKLGHSIIKPVPSLFTFNIKNELIIGLAGISTTNAEISIKDQKLREAGPLLITHWGLSGPAILKLSAWGARIFHDMNYHFTIYVNWLSDEEDTIMKELLFMKQNHGKKMLFTSTKFGLPKRLWQRMVTILKVEKLNFGDLNSKQIDGLVKLLGNCEFQVKGKNTFKDEFVTAGGIDTKEINFKTMESRLFSNLYFAGEVINIDAVTGGFNFQAAWTEAYLAADSIAG